MREQTEVIDMVGQASAMAARRVTEYVEVWERAVSRMASSEYHAEDLLDDWFSLWGKAVRDSAATAAWLWRGYRDDAAAPSAEAGADDG